MTAGRLWLVGAVALVVAESTPASRAGAQATFRAASDVVAVYATVRDRRGALVRGLSRDDFEVREDGERREITTFSSDLQPITLAMVLDRSGSLAARSREVSAAAHGFFTALREGDRVSLSSLSWDCVPLTDDVERLSRVVSQQMPPDLGSPIWDAVDRAFFAMADQPGRRAILVFSDGIDSGPGLTRLPGSYQGPCQPGQTATGASFREVAARAARNGVLVYAVGVSPTGGDRRDGDLRTLARDTGGELYRMQDGQSLTPVFERIADELHHQYLLGFVPVRRDGRVASIDVRVKRAGLDVRARRRFSVEPDAPAASGEVAVLPVAPLTEAEVRAAIADGLRGRTSRATCLTPVTTGGSYFEVALEGPTGRIMRAAREAQQRDETFDESSVTDRLRGPTVRVTAAVKLMPSPTNPTTAQDGAERPMLQPPQVTSVTTASGLRLRSVGDRPRVVEPTIATSLRLRPGSPFEAEFDLADVRALGDPVEAIVLTGMSAGARCRVSGRSLQALR